MERQEDCRSNCTNVAVGIVCLQFAFGCTETRRPSDPESCLQVVFGHGEDRRAVRAKAVRIFSDQRIEAIDLQRQNSGTYWRPASGNMVITGDYTIRETSCAGL